jgi:hypothetical protein
LTVGGKTYQADYAGTTNAERTRIGATAFHHSQLGLSAKTVAGQDTGFIRDPEGTLNSVTTGGQSYYYLTDAIGSVVAVADEAGNKVNSYSYSPRGVTRSSTTEQVPQPYRFAGSYQDLRSEDSLSNARKRGRGLRIATSGAALTGVGAGASALNAWDGGASLGQVRLVLPLAISLVATLVFVIGMTAILRDRPNS